MKNYFEIYIFRMKNFGMSTFPIYLTHKYTVCRRVGQTEIEFQ